MKNDLLIEIFKENEVIDVFEGVSQKNNKPFRMLSQIGYAHVGGKFPKEFKIRLQDGQPYWPAGKYLLGMNSLVVGMRGDLEIGREMFLIPVNQ